MWTWCESQLCSSCNNDECATQTDARSVRIRVLRSVGVRSPHCVSAPLKQLHCVWHSDCRWMRCYIAHKIRSHSTQYNNQWPVHYRQLYQSSPAYLKWHATPCWEHLWAWIHQRPIEIQSTWSTDGNHAFCFAVENVFYVAVSVLTHSPPTLWDRTKESSDKSAYRSIGMCSRCHSPASSIGHFPSAWQLNSYLSADWYTLKVIISWGCRKVSANSPSCTVNLREKWEKTVLMFNLII